MKRFLILLLLLFLIPSLIFALSAPQIYFATDDELRSMVDIRGLEEGTREEMQNALYEYEGLAAYEVVEGEDEAADDEYILTINQAQNFTREGDRVVLTGNSSISIENEGTVSELSADTIIVDTRNSRLTALENVSYTTDDESASIQDITADIVTVSWESGWAS